MILTIAVFLEVGFAFWYLVMAIMLLRSIAKSNGLVLAMVFLNVSNLFGSGWIILALIVLPMEFIVAKIPLDIFKAIVVTYFMWKLRDR